jgi:hypothetical protein
MGLRYEDLDPTTRALMVEEIDQDVAANRIYLSSYLNAEGQSRWPNLLREAAASGTDDSFAKALQVGRCLRATAPRNKPAGGQTMVSVPYTAAQTLAESQFNMYYMRALARRAIAEGHSLIVYRAKQRENPRPESERMIGTKLDPNLVLQVLRRTRGVEPEIGIPMPNTGITVRLG